MYSTAWQPNILPGLQREITPTKLSGSAWQLLWALRGIPTLTFIEKSPNTTAWSLTWPGHSHKLSPQQIPTGHVGQARTAHRNLHEALGSVVAGTMQGFPLKDKIISYPSSGSPAELGDSFSQCPRQLPLGIDEAYLYWGLSTGPFNGIIRFLVCGVSGRNKNCLSEAEYLLGGQLFNSPPELTVQGEKMLKTLCVCVWF